MVRAVWTPSWTLLLVLSGPGLVGLAHALAPPGGSRLEARVTVALLTLALPLSAVHLTARVLHDFRPALIVGLVVPAALGAALAWRRRHEPAPTPPAAKGGVPVLLTAAGAVVLMAPAALRFAFHDETLYLGHFSMTSAIVNGPYPPHHLTFPQDLLRYHYAFDLLSALLARVLGLRVDLAIDVATLGLAFLTVVAAAPVVRRACAGPVPAPLLLLVLFAGGLPFLAPNDADFCPSGALCEVLSMKWVGTGYINPPLSSNFFQHPFSLGLPLTLGVLAMALRLEGDDEVQVDWRTPVTLGLLLAPLALGHAVLFVGLVPSLAVVFAVGAARGRRPARWGLGATLAAAAAAPLYGGFFALGGPGGGARFVFAEGGVAGGLEASLVWLLASLGLALPLGLLGLRRLARGRALFALLVVGNLVVLNAVRYEHSWDIVKFATAAHLYLALISIETLRAMGDRAGLGPKLLTGVAAVTTAGFGAAYMFPFWGDTRLPHQPALVGEGRYPGLADDDAESLDWVRAHAEPYALVYRAPPAALRWAQLGGVAQVWTDIGTESFADAERIARRTALRRGLTCEGLAAEGVRWVVLGPEDPPAHAALMAALAAADAAVERFHVGRFTVFERVGDACPGP
jgi:hypothetical protein